MQRNMVNHNSSENDLSKEPGPPGAGVGNAPPSRMNIGSSGKEPVESDERDISVTDNTAVPSSPAACKGVDDFPCKVQDSEVICCRIIPDDAPSSDLYPRKGTYPSDYKGTYPSDCKSTYPSDYKGNYPSNCKGTYPSDYEVPSAGGDSVAGYPSDYNVPSAVSPLAPDDDAVAAGEYGATGGSQVGAPEPYIPPDPLTNYSQYIHYKAMILTASARKFLSNHLNQNIEGLSEQGYVKNWQGLAECMRKDPTSTNALGDRFRDPTGELLKDWTKKAKNTIGDLLGFLKLMDRYDILDDPYFLNMIRKSVAAEREREEEVKQEQELQQKRSAESSHKSMPMTGGDVETGEPEMFDAFVCFDDDDSDFVLEMLDELEEGLKCKLCISARDLLAGQNEQVVTAEMMRSRCNKTIVVLSKAFVREDSEMCQFAMRVAQSLNPAAKRSKIIPLMKESCIVPTSLNHITPVDFTRCSQRSWQWQKVKMSLESDRDIPTKAEEELLVKITLDPNLSAVDLRASMRKTKMEKETESDIVTVQVEPDSILSQNTLDETDSPASSSSEKSKKKKTTLKKAFNFLLRKPKSGCKSDTATVRVVPDSSYTPTDKDSSALGASSSPQAHKKGKSSLPKAFKPLTRKPEPS